MSSTQSKKLIMGAQLPSILDSLSKQLGSWGLVTRKRTFEWILTQNYII